MRISGWAGFALWALVGCLYGLVYLGILSIGMFILPIAIVATIAAARRCKVWPEILGMMLGPAAAMMRLGALNSGFRACAPGEQPYAQASASGSGSATTGTYAQIQHLEGCVTWNAQLLMWSGVALAVAVLGIYLAIQYRARAAKVN